MYSAVPVAACSVQVRHAPVSQAAEIQQDMYGLPTRRVHDMYMCVAHGVVDH